jgi:hypothetical protein
MSCSRTAPRAHRQQRLASFIASIAELRKSRPAGSVTYSRPMPDVEAVMQVCGCV